jgi:anti-sigma factor ChrR (cupin superfamily)
MMENGEAINGDLAIRAVMDTHSMRWTASPSGTVWRKRLHLVGAPESGQVTSIVRYEAESSFPTHDHPAGEEIFVLEGVFSDEHGDWPAGTYLLNPEGFRHAPFSRQGCLLFVKLRQFPGLDREHHVIDTASRDWEPTRTRGVWCKPLYSQPGYRDKVRLERWEAGTSGPLTRYELGAEFFVIEGEFADEEGVYPAGTWLRIPRGGSHSPVSLHGCRLYIKQSGIPYLTSVSS